MGHSSKALLPSQQRPVIEACIRAGLIASELEWETTAFDWMLRQEPVALDGIIVSKLVHKPSQSYYVFGFTPDGACIELFSPGSDCLLFASGSHTDQELRDKYVVQWSGYLIREIGEKAFVDALMEAPVIQQAILESVDNSRFSDTEQASVSAKLDELKEMVLGSHEFTTAQAERVNLQFEHLRSESAHVGRKSWALMAFGCLVSIIMGVNIDEARQIWQSATAVIAGLLE